MRVREQQILFKIYNGTPRYYYTVTSKKAENIESRWTQHNPDWLGGQAWLRMNERAYGGGVGSTELFTGTVVSERTIITVHL